MLETNELGSDQPTPLDAAKETGRRLLVETGRAPDGWEAERWRHFEIGCIDGTISVRQLAAGLARLTPAATERVLEPLRALTTPPGDAGTLHEALSSLALADAMFVGAAIMGDLDETEDCLHDRRQQEARVLAALRRVAEDAPSPAQAM